MDCSHLIWRKRDDSPKKLTRSTYLSSRKSGSRELKILLLPMDGSAKQGTDLAQFLEPEHGFVPENLPVQ
jgi:hypothetical protein